jgi:hypothetical protein
MCHIGTDFRNRLLPCMFEAVQILKGGYKAGTISAAAEVEALEAGAESSMDLNVASDSSTAF